MMRCRKTRWGSGGCGRSRTVTGAVILLWSVAATAQGRVLEVLDARVTKLVAPDARLDVVTAGQTWTEGPLSVDANRLLFADIKTNSIRSVDGRGRVRILRHPSGYDGPAPYPGPEPGSSAMAFDPHRRVVVAGHAGRAMYRYDGLPGPHRKRVTLVDRFRGRRLNSPNDLAITRDGTIYFTDPPFGLPTQATADPLQELTFAGVYRLVRPGAATQTLELISDGLKGPNGLAWSPDEKTLYVANTPSKTWVKFVRRADGTLEGPTPFAECGGDPRPGEPDGLKVDQSGHVFAAAPGGVWILSPVGEHLGTVRVPKRTTNVAFGGPGGRTLFITAGDTIYNIRTKTNPRR